MAEQMILPALRKGGYEVERQVAIGTRLGGKGRHLVDAVAKKDEKSFLISKKWQQTSGTAEQKVPYEAMCLANAVEESEGKYVKAYLVLGGAGWTLRDFYISGGLNRYMQGISYVEILALEGFVARANRGAL